MRKRRKPRVVWLPLNQADSIRADQLSTFKFGQLPLDSTTVGNGNHIEFALVADGFAQGQDPTVTANSLADLEQSGYRLRRIVGKIFIFAGQFRTGGEDVQPGITHGGVAAITAGFMVRREAQTGASMASIAGALEMAPDSIDNVGDPWIWRRTWIVADRSNDVFNYPQDPANPAAGLTSPDGPGPDNFSWGPSALDGPHVDAKTARIIGPEERLFLNVTGRVLFAGTNAQWPIDIGFDLRFLASMRTNTGNRKNSSR